MFQPPASVEKTVFLLQELLVEQDHAFVLEAASFQNPQFAFLRKILGQVVVAGLDRVDEA